MGTLLIVTVLEGLRAVPGVGGLLVLIAATVALGGVLLTRFGTRVFVPEPIGTEEPPLPPEHSVTAPAA